MSLSSLNNEFQSFLKKIKDVPRPFRKDSLLDEWSFRVEQDGALRVRTPLHEHIVLVDYPLPALFFLGFGSAATQHYLSELRQHEWCSAQRLRLVDKAFWARYHGSWNSPFNIRNPNLVAGVEEVSLKGGEVILCCDAFSILAVEADRLIGISLPLQDRINKTLDADAQRRTQEKIRIEHKKRRKSDTRNGEGRKIRAENINRSKKINPATRHLPKPYRGGGIRAGESPLKKKDNRCVNKPPTTPNMYLKISILEHVDVWKAAQLQGTNKHDFVRTTVLRAAADILKDGDKLQPANV